MGVNSLLQTFYFVVELEGLAAGGRILVDASGFPMLLPQGFRIADGYWGVESLPVDPGGGLTNVLAVGYDGVSDTGLIFNRQIAPTVGPAPRGQFLTTTRANGVGLPNLSQQGHSIVVTNVGTAPIAGAAGTVPLYLYLQGNVEH